MESGRSDLECGLEVNGTNGSVATYKSLTEDDSGWATENKKKTDTMGKKDELELEDGAKEKMLDEETSINPNKSPTEVIFISENGDAKIDIQNVKNTLSGMGKEELMKYANDPFWIRLRWILFIGFWVIWFAMLGGAIAIIALAPKCTAPKPKTWWTKSPIVQLDPIDIEGKDIKNVENLLDTLNNHDVKIISMASFLKGSPGATEDFVLVKPEIGDINYIEKIIEAAKNRGQRVVLELDPNHSSINHPWFIKSVKKEDPYTNYYVWTDSKKPNVTQPPNNWLSVNGGSAWTWNNERKQHYLHQFRSTQPDLNFHNPDVIKEFNDIFEFWLQRGISGFRLGKTQYLIEDPTLQDEKVDIRVPADPDDYRYLIHVRTRDRSENAKILKGWRDIVANFTGHDEFFSLRDDIGSDTLAVFNENQRLIDLPQSSRFFTTANVSTTATTYRDGINYWVSGVNVSWPGWDLNGEEIPLRKRMPETADSIVLMSMLLPGTPILKLNDVLSTKDAFSTLAAKRREETFLYGDFKSYIINGTVFVYTRIKSGLPGYLVAYQSSDKDAVIDVSNLSRVPLDVTVLTYSSNYAQNGTIIQTKMYSNNIDIAARSTLVVSFAPKD